MPDKKDDLSIGAIALCKICIEFKEGSEKNLGFFLSSKVMFSS